MSYLSVSQGLSGKDAVSANGMVFLGWAIGAPLTAWFSDVIHRRRLFLQIGALFSVLLFCAVIYIPHLTKPMLFSLLFLFGVATSVEVIVFAISRELSERHIAATAISLTNAFVMLGGILFQNIIGWLLDLNWQGLVVNGVNVYSAHAYQFALSAILGALLIGLVLSFFIKETHCKQLG